MAGKMVASEDRFISVQAANGEANQHAGAVTDTQRTYASDAVISLGMRAPQACSPWMTLCSMNGPRCPTYRFCGNPQFIRSTRYFINLPNVAHVRTLAYICLPRNHGNVLKEINE